jgi:hypothetical protein
MLPICIVPKYSELSSRRSMSMPRNHPAAPGCDWTCIATSGIAVGAAEGASDATLPAGGALVAEVADGVVSVAALAGVASADDPEDGAVVEEPVEVDEAPPQPVATVAASNQAKEM